MPKLLRNRWLRWSLFVGALVALGVGIYRIQPPEPMCEIVVGQVEPRAFVDGGRRLATLPISNWRSGHEHNRTFGPLEIWDTQTGTLLATHFKSAEELYGAVFSPDGRQFAAVIEEQPRFGKPNPFVIVDVVTGNIRELAKYEGSGWGTKLQFSKDGSLLMRDGRNWWEVFETARGRRLETPPGALLEDYNAQTMLFSFPHSAGVSRLLEWSIADNKPVAGLEGVASPTICSPDGRFGLAKRTEKPFTWVVWNRQTYQLEAEFEAEISPTPTPIISEDGRWLASFRKDKKDKQGHFVELRELPHGQYHGKALVQWPRPIATFSPGGRFLAIRNEGATASDLFLDVPTLKDAALSGSVVAFSHDARRVFMRSVLLPPEVRCHDLDTKRLHTTFPFGGFVETTGDRRTILIHQGPQWRPPPAATFWGRVKAWFTELVRPGNRTPDVLVVIDTDTLAERFRITGWETRHALLSDDGRTLATTHELLANLSTLRCWDLDAPKPLYWSMGVPAGLGALGVLFAFRLRRRTVSVKPGGAPCPS